jgi:hypothetical protein
MSRKALTRTNVIQEIGLRISEPRGVPMPLRIFQDLRVPDGLDPLNPRSLPCSGAVAGLIARIDSTRGVWKAPAGKISRIDGGEPEDVLTASQNGSIEFGRTELYQNLSRSREPHLGRPHTRRC